MKKNIMFLIIVSISLLVIIGLFIGLNSQGGETVPSNTAPSGAAETTPPPSVAQDQKTIYALGDSLTAGYQLPLEESYPMQLEALLTTAGYDYVVVNGGKSGDTSAGLYARIDWLTNNAGSGDSALLVIGANDGLQSLELDQLEVNIRRIITALQEKDVTVILGGMQLPTNLDPVYREQFTALYPGLATEFDLPLIDFFLEDVATVPTLNLADGIHPNKAGYAIIAQNTLEFLEENELISK